METRKIEFQYELYNDSSALHPDELSLLEMARATTKIAYAPYSKFKVGAAAKLSNGQVVTGTNQENASYPVGICAERVLLGTAANLFPNEAIQLLAISYDGEGVANNQPISPCGMCRQALVEFEKRMDKPMRIILAGQEGKVIVVATALSFLPLAFTSDELK